MSFGLSIGDLRIVWQLVSFLHEKCFTKAFGADVQYLRFGREVESFAENIQQLLAITEHANKQRPKRPWKNQDDDCRQSLLPLSQAVGDFQATLKDCETLLNDHNRFQRDAANFIDNVVWHMGTQRDVEILRERIHFHSTKLLIILKPFELHLLLEIRQELRDLRREVAELKGILVGALAGDALVGPSDPRQIDVALPNVPPEIQHRFLLSAQTSVLVRMSGETDMPLTEGFDGLVYHFARSTVEFNPGIDQSQKIPDEMQFVNLLKSKWIMEHLEKSIHLQELGDTSLWASYLYELKSDIIREYKRFHTNQLVAPPQDVIVRLPEESFSVWASAAPPLHPSDLAQPRPLEDLILELTLPDSTASRKVTLSVFRRSAIECRLVTTTKDLHNPGYHQEMDFIANTNAMKVVPAYASPDAAVEANNLLLSSSHVQDLRWQYLSSPDDVHMLQQALLGYRVHHSMPNVSWSVDGSSKPGKSGKGVLQLWQLQSLPNVHDQESNVIETTVLEITAHNNGYSSPSLNSPNASSVRSPASARRQSTFATTSSTLFSGNSATTTITGSRGNGTAIVKPDPPVLILLTQIYDQHAFVHVELDHLTYVNTEACDCRRNSKKPCRAVILENKSKSGLSIRRSTSAQKSLAGKGLYTWDLATFRSPKHPDFDAAELLAKVKYLRLDFVSVEAKDLFKKELIDLEKVRTLDLQTHYGIMNEKREKDQRPTDPTKYLAPKAGEDGRRGSGKSSRASSIFRVKSRSDSYVSTTSSR